ncbi:uncharacterized protein LOC135485957 [Lineus longissimus]|uniref:uncharacterized protein LOC135485957 n=1 Tax=Lineus longissimus TaxID=88925 RepID=UPI00315D260F
MNNPCKEEVYLSAAQIIYCFKRMEVTCHASTAVNAVPEKVSLKTYLINVMGMKSPSWRMNMAASGKGSVVSALCLKESSLLGTLKEETMEAIINFLRDELPQTEMITMMNVCVPEVGLKFDKWSALLMVSLYESKAHDRRET